MRKNPPIQSKSGWSIREVVTVGMRRRYQAIPPDAHANSAIPLRKSYNSAAADTHRVGAP